MELLLSNDNKFYKEFHETKAYNLGLLVRLFIISGNSLQTFGIGWERTTFFWLIRQSAIIGKKNCKTNQKNVCKEGYELNCL